MRRTGRALIGLVLVLALVGLVLVRERPVRTTSGRRSESPTTTPQPTTTPRATTTAPRPVGHGVGVRRYALPTDQLSVHVAGGRLIDPKGKPEQLVGVNTSGTEGSCVENHRISFAPLDDAEAAGMVAAHVDVVRIPLNEDCWLGINGVPSLDGGYRYQAAIRQWVSILNNDGITAILDLQLTAPGRYVAAQLWPMADEDHSVTFWSQVATAYRTDPAVMFDLFNEPYLGGGAPTAADWSCWLEGCTSTTDQSEIKDLTTTVSYRTAGMQQLVNAVRRAGASQAILLGGLRYASGPCTTGSSDGACMWLRYMPVDPLHNLLASFHNYEKGACGSERCWNAQLQPLRAAKVPLFTGELGEEDCGVGFMNSYMEWADRHDVSYLAWVWQPTPPTATRCVDYPADGYQINHDLLSNWSGAPSLIAPEGGNYIAHLGVVARRA